MYECVTGSVCVCHRGGALACDSFQAAVLYFLSPNLYYILDMFPQVSSGENFCFIKDLGLAGGAGCGPRFLFYLKLCWTRTQEELLK